MAPDSDFLAEIDRSVRDRERVERGARTGPDRDRRRQRDNPPPR